MDMQGRVVLITGGAGSIGKATALRLAKRGAKICITDIDETLIKSAIEEFRQEGIDAIAVAVNASDRKDVAVVVETCQAKYGIIDTLVNTAGIYKHRLFVDMTDEEWNETIRINLGSVFACCKETIGGMIEKRFGRIITLTSQAGISGSVMHAHYAASKAAIIGLTCTLARELSEYGINVNCIAPGIIESRMTSDLPQERKEYFMQNIPLKKFGKAEDVAGVIAFLASKDADYMTGQTINITGGWLMHS